MHDAKLQTTQNGKISCPTCKKILKFSEQMNADHETVCMFCGTVLYEQIESVSSSENVSESSANLSINLVGDYQKLLPSKMKSNFSSLKRFYINRPELSTFSTICQWLELPTHVSQEAWMLYKKASNIKKCVKADAALFALMYFVSLIQYHEPNLTFHIMSDWEENVVLLPSVRNVLRVC